MKHVFTTALLLNYARRGALLLALGAAGPAALGQSFGPATSYSTGINSEPASVVLGDVNRDGRLDIVTANANSNAVGVLLGQTGGTFASALRYPAGTGSSPNCVKLADVNNDGLPDAVTANPSPSMVGVLLGQPAGTFAAPMLYSTGGGNSTSGVALGDVNGDGQADIVATNLNGYAVEVLLTQSGGTFAAAVPYGAGPATSPYDVALGDVNRDGRLDIVTVNSNANTASVLLGQVGGTFAPAALYSTGASSNPFNVVLGDVNGDGRLDIVTANYGSSSVGVLLGQANGSFAASASTYTTGAGDGPFGVALGDVNGDGRLDIVTANPNSTTAGVLLGQINGTFAAIVKYATGPTGSPRSVALGDVNGDGRPDIVTVSNGSSTDSVLLNTGTFTPLATARPTAADLALYPNPARGSFTVQLPAGLAPGPAELLNSLGQVVRRSAAAAPRFTVETAGLAPGIYTLRLALGAAGTVARRVVVE